MKWRWITYFVCLASIICLSWLRRPSKDKPAAVWLATRKLMVNSRIFTNYLREPLLSEPTDAWKLPSLSEFDGKYVVVEVTNGGVVAFENLSAEPHLTNNSSGALFYYSVQDIAFALPYVNTGSLVAVGDGNSSNEIGTFPVETILGSGGSFTIAIRVPTNEVERIWHVAKPHLRLVSNQ